MFQNTIGKKYYEENNFKSQRVPLLDDVPFETFSSCNCTLIFVKKLRNISVITSVMFIKTSYVDSYYLILMENLRQKSLK